MHLFLRYSQTTELLHGGEGAQLIIEKVERDDSASFLCTAINDFGEDSMNFQLTIQGKINLRLE